MEFFPSCGQTMLAERRKPSGLVRKNEIKQKVEKQAVNLRKIAY